jgi:hypothetical protein
MVHPPAQQSSHNLNSISVSVKPALQKLPRVTEAARELKSSAWPDIDEASEGRLPQHFIDFISSSPKAPILNSPPKANPTQMSAQQLASSTAQRKSRRLADKAKLHPGLNSTQLAQNILINKLGKLSPPYNANSAPDINVLMQHIPRPFTAMKMEAEPAPNGAGKKFGAVLMHTLRCTGRYSIFAAWTEETSDAS